MFIKVQIWNLIRKGNVMFFKAQEGKKIKCDLCGKIFTPGNQPDGSPNGAGIMKNGRTVNVCYECILGIEEGNEVLQKKLGKLCNRG